jgi:hypothetical protein
MEGAPNENGTNAKMRNNRAENYDFGDKNKAQAKGPSEKTITQNIIKKLRTIEGVRVLKRSTGWNRAGEPDVTGCYKGVRFELELKVPGKKPTELQTKRLKEWRESGAVSYWTDNVDDAMRWFYKYVKPLGDFLELHRMDSGELNLSTLKSIGGPFQYYP